MKRLSTSNNVRTRVLALITGLLLSGFLPGFAATKHVVQVTDFSFSPSNVTIKAGDTVEWRNVQGFHNVNGSKGIFPNNPVSFGNNVGAEWTYKFVFLNTGIYNYQCDPHASMGMTGIVTVTVSTSIQSLFNGDQDLASIQLYPNPSAGKVTLQIPSSMAGNLDMSVFDVTGKLRFTANSTVQDLKEIDLENLDKGMYLVEFRGESWRKTMKLLLE